MKVKMLQSMYGPDVTRNAGDEIDVSAEEGQRLVEGGLAELVRSAKAENTAKNAKAEKAVK